MPSEEDFPFSVRVTADTLSSSGSSSMAAVCAASLALRTAGVPTAALAAGISVGLVTQAPPQLGTPSGSTHQATGSTAAAAAAAGDAGAAATAGDNAAAAAAGQQHHQEEQGGAASLSSAVGYIDPCSYSSFVAAGLNSQQQQQQQQQVDAAESSPSNAEASCSSSSSDSEGSSSDSSGSSSDDDDSDAASSSSSSSSSGGLSIGGVLSSSYGRALLLTDIQGIEDHLGDMDFKVREGLGVGF